MVHVNRYNSCNAFTILASPHYRFREFLKHKALFLGKEVIIVTEEYTTKGCSRCGLVTDIGGSKTFTCQHCGFVAPRDAKSARDIFAKHIVSPA
jgi:putative transposase